MESQPQNPKFRYNAEKFHPFHTLYQKKQHDRTYPSVLIKSTDLVDTDICDLIVVNCHSVWFVLEYWWELISENIDYNH